jgi:hypothetical protein
MVERNLRVLLGRWILRYPENLHNLAEQSVVRTAPL